MDKILRSSLSARTLAGGGLGSISIRVGPMVETSKSSFFAYFAGNERKYRIQPHDLAVQFIVCVGNHMVFLIGCQHKIGEGMSNTIEKDAAAFTLWRLGSSRNIRRQKIFPDNASGNRSRIRWIRSRL
jgi:hypothetical protein